MAARASLPLENPPLINDVEDLLQHHKVTKECTCRKCPENFLTTKVAGIIVDWKALAPYLGMLDPDVVAIERDGVDEEDKRRKLLQRWLKRNGPEATYYKLIEAFIGAKDKNTADEICKHLADEAKEECLQLKKVKVSEKDTEDENDVCSSTNNKESEVEQKQPVPPFGTVGRVIGLMASDDFRAVQEKINILLIGPTGAGKSTLVNTIFGEEIAKVEHGGSACQHDKLVTPYELPLVEISDGRIVQIVIYDAVGFKESERKDKALLKYIKDNVPKVHLLLVCHKLYDKVCDSTIKLVKLLAEHFTRDILNHTLFLLTHADNFVNRQPHRRSQGKDTQAIKEEFEARFENMKHLLNEAATEKFSKIDRNINLQFCLTCDDTTLSLPNKDKWEYEMWMFILHTCDEEAKVILSYWASVQRKIKLLQMP